MFDTLPEDPLEVLNWSWVQYQPFVDDLISRHLIANNVSQFLADWSRLMGFWSETYARLYIATALDTTDEAAQQKFEIFLDGIYPKSQSADQEIKEKFLASELEPEGFEIPLRNLRAQAALFREANLPLLSEELKLTNAFEKIIGTQTVMWEGEEKTLPQLKPVYQDTDRSLRERAWRLVSERQLTDRRAINDSWCRLMKLRLKQATNADMPNYRAYQWQKLLRFDYTPEDCVTFQNAIESVVVPAAERIYERRRQRLGVGELRPWDLDVDPLGRPPLRSFSEVAELEQKSAVIFGKVDLKLGTYFNEMRQGDLLNLANYKGKAAGAFCFSLMATRKPFLLGNAVGLHEDVQMLLHEAGHAFHVFESADIPYFQQLEIPMEFAEVASMAMELLASPYLVASEGGFYTDVDAARARIEHLEESILFWPYMAVVDAFQHWVYENPQDGSDPAKCDAVWSALWDRFMKGVDWSGLEDAKATGWQRKIHIHTDPFYYVEYGLAQLGAVQVWANALQDQTSAVAAYRKALSLGATVTLPELFALAGARFAFDEITLGEAIRLMEKTIDELSP